MLAAIPSGLIVLSVVVGIVLVAAYAGLKILRFVGDKTGNRELINNGIVLADDGIFLQRFFVGRKKVPFDDIESVEFVRSSDDSLLTKKYGPSVYSHPGGDLSEEGTVVVKFKESRSFARYHLYKPANAARLAEKLRKNLQESRGASGG